MSNVNALLNERLKKSNPSKMAMMVSQSTNGNLTSFAGVFSISELSEKEKSYLEALLYEYSNSKNISESDLKDLILITSEVKAINNQAAILHGERIKKAHAILTKYRDGAFTAWLINAYGNRQTPYNFLQYYEFCEALPKTLRPKVDLMPRQAIYTLASRVGPLEKKQILVEKYKGETKNELLRAIRDAFPLSQNDKRKENIGDSVINTLCRLYDLLDKKQELVTKKQKTTINEYLESIKKIINDGR